MKFYDGLRVVPTISDKSMQNYYISLTFFYKGYSFYYIGHTFYIQTVPFITQLVRTLYIKIEHVIIPITCFTKNEDVSYCDVILLFILFYLWRMSTIASCLRHFWLMPVVFDSIPVWSEKLIQKMKYKACLVFTWKKWGHG